MSLDLAHEATLAGLRTSISAFTRTAFNVVANGKRYLHNWHIDCMADYLHAAHMGEIKRLVINIPPRSLKSIMVSVAFPAWVMGKNPAAQFIVGSFSQDIAIKHSVDTRLLMQSEIYRELFPKTIIADDQNEKRKFQTTARGHRIATSVHGSITGEGGDYLILDDPIKPDEALSDTVRNGTNDWIEQVFMSRENQMGLGRFIMVMQRVHEDDPAGRWLSKGDCVHLNLPAEFVKKTFIEIRGKRYPKEGYFEAGDLLHPLLMPKEELELKRRDIGEYAYAGQYLQMPAPLGGGALKREWLQHENVAGTNMNKYILVDPANSKKKGGDYTAMIVVGLNDDRSYYILDIVRDKMNIQERAEKLFELVKRWNPIAVGYEKYGMMLDVDYVKEVMQRKNYRFNVVELKGTSLSKEDRIKKLIPLFMEKRVYLPEYGFFKTDLDGKPIDLVKSFVEEEYAPFPVGKHDDMIDALARILDEELGAVFPKPRDDFKHDFDRPKKGGVGLYL